MTEVLWQLLREEPSTLTCDECFAVMEYYAELLTQGGEQLLPAIEKHLGGCPSCETEHRAALQRLVKLRGREKLHQTETDEEHRGQKMSEQGTIAVGVDDDGHVWPAHFGMAPWYYLFDSHGELIERRPNRHAQTGKHHDDPARIVALLPECTTFIAHRMGDRSHRRLAESLGIHPVLTVATNPYEAVKAYLKEQGD